MLRVAYLTVYNGIGLVGWTYILSQMITIISTGRYTKLWKEQGTTILAVQSLAVMEILHALIGLVRSPIARTFPQVFSRIWIVWVVFDSLYTHPYTPFNAGGCESLEDPLCTEEMMYQIGVMTVMAWCYAEIIRYSYYIFYTFDPKWVPKPLNFLRYSAFIVLYPVGITGELLCCFLTLPLIKKGLCAPLGGFGKGCPDQMENYMYLYMLMYIPAFPFLYFGMLGERKKRLFPRRVPKLQGVVFPETKPGERSTSNTGREIFAKAVEAVDPAAAAKVRKEKNWRFGYIKHVVDHLVTCAKSEKAALTIAQAGLDCMYNSFDFITEEGKTLKFGEALKTITDKKFSTHTIKGQAKPKAKFEISVPYKCFHTGKDHGELKGLELIAQVDKWVEHGTIEPDCGDAIKKVVQNPQFCDLRNEYFVLLGTTSAMGPFLVLKELGANIIAIDLDRPMIWKKIIETVNDSCATVTFPIKEPYKGQSGEELYQIAGCNLMNDVPYICTWLKDVVPKTCGGKAVTVGGYAYLDGELHVRVNLACDAIMNSVIESYGANKVRLANLATPTDVYLVGKDTHEACVTNLKQAPLWQKAFQALLLGKRLIPNALKPIKADDGSEVYHINGLIPEQGPNYALSKRLQQWRAVLARAKGVTVSMNIAPASATASVVSNKTFALVYGGMHVFKPMEIFYQEVSNSVMAALMLHDIMNPMSPASPGYKLQNPFHLLIQSAFHGGSMRCLYQTKSVGEVAALVSLWIKYSVFITITLLSVITGFWMRAM
eukprot:CAMPEP_0177706440 /NCGR_PEP_ID=MMETSP0484_2-20121128/9227_1 /TAXON_ID=354590 /ORGANISM="Rhodomonas lens, Strain RHODO" /LENGTH=770 /DNA_ID=CAMNT_0019217903 /DNA_START=71 /DNA_END=2383 /DNA_ORIENTATION=+